MRAGVRRGVEKEKWSSACARCVRRRSTGLRTEAPERPAREIEGSCVPLHPAGQEPLRGSMAEIDHHDEQPPTLAPPVAASAPSPEDPEAPPPEEPTLVAENGHSNAQERDGDEFESDGTRTAVPAAADAAVENGDELERAETADQHSPRPVSKDFGSVPPPPPKLAVIPADEDAASELSDEPGAREVRSTSLTSDGTFEDVALSQIGRASCRERVS